MPEGAPSPPAPVAPAFWPEAESSVSASSDGMSSGLTNPCTTWSAASLPTVTMQPAMVMSSGLKTARALMAASISARRGSISSASSISSSVHWSSSMLTSSSWRTWSCSISAFSPSVGSAGVARTRPKLARSDQSTSTRALRPLPARGKLVGGDLEPVHGELVQQHRVLDPDAVLVLVREEVAQDRAAGGLVGVDADEADEGGAGRQPVLGQQALDLPVGGPVALVLDPVPGGQLARGVAGDGEGLEGGEVDLVCAVGVEQLGRGAAEAQALFHGALGDAEAGRDVGDGGACDRERAECLHLVGGVHGDPHGVLGERDLGVGRAVADDAAENRVVVGEDAVVGELGEGGEAPAAGDDGVARLALAVRADGAGHEVVLQAVGGDGGLQLDEGVLGGGGPAHVGGGDLELVEGHGEEGGIGHVRSPGEDGWK